ncbi:MAG: hypothetical protein GQ540_03720 [Lutibacter sp.]|uniref:hypothetical protein n=1 Tax=Lutibacter sp. TaxID=1925666 RepID=UPI0019EC01AC|nr:hypothetical protein [Lutibacter sp.]NOR27621.1 hypothetical protein [Lutibacter sp.]
MSSLNTTVPARTQTIGEVIDSTKNNFVLTDSEIDRVEGLVSTSTTTSSTNLSAHNDSATAHGVDALDTRITANEDELFDGRGTKDTLDERLSVAIEQDGTIRLSEFSGRYIDNSDVATYVDNRNFTVPGDRTGVYIVGAILRITVVSGYVYGIVQSSTYTTSTNVQLLSDYQVLTNPISKVEMSLLAFDNAVETVAATNSTDITNLQNQMSAYLATGDKTLTNSDSPYTVLATDRVLICDTTAGSITIDYPAVATSENRQLVVKKIIAANTVTRDGNSSETIDGSTTQAMTTQWDKATDYCNGTEWFQIA